MENNTVDSKTAADYLDPTREPEPSAETGLGTHFNNTYDPAMKKNAPQLPSQSAPQPSAAQKLSQTSSSMTTAQLQAAAAEGDPNNLQKKRS